MDIRQALFLRLFFNRRKGRLVRADLRGADLLRADFTDADLTYALVIDSQLSAVASLDGVTLPDGSVGSSEV